METGPQAHPASTPVNEQSGASTAALEVSMPPLARTLRDTIPGAIDNSSGPFYPVFAEDVPIVDTLLFGPQFVPERAGAKSELLPRVTVACDADGTSSCRVDLEACFLWDPTSISQVCACYKQYAACYRSYHCFDLLPRAEIMYCFDTMRCSLNECEATQGQSSGASGVAIPWSALVVLLLGMILVAGAAFGSLLT